MLAGKFKMMKKILSCLILTLCLAAAVLGQASQIVKRDLSAADVERIVKKFTENESDFRGALTNYVFKRFAVVQIIGLGGNVTGNYQRDSFMTFGSDGGRFERVLRAPPETTPPHFVTPEDLDDLGGVTPFALEPSAVQLYNIAYVGVERIDQLNLYVFDVSPKVMPDPKKTKMRVFSGRIWVDTDDLMIVKSKGKAGPETKTNKFPTVETTREQVDGKYWFPSDARSDDELVFNNGAVVKLRIRVKYADYKLGRNEVKIGDEDLPTVPEPSPPLTPKKP